MGLAFVLLAVCAVMVVPAIAQAPTQAPPGTNMQLYSWVNRADMGQWTEAGRCLAQGFRESDKDKKVYSQFGEDGIIEFIFSCIGRNSSYYVEFGTETCNECTTKYLREKGWTGLLMDGGIENPTINLHKEFMRSDNIVSLFKKHSVPLKFDHMTVDIDQNTPWVLRAILAGGYRPRSVAIEYNRNFRNTEAYMVMDTPTSGPDGCWFGASGLALERIMRAFHYSLVAFDHSGVNIFFVHDEELGGPFPHSFADVTPNYGLEAWKPIHGDCQNRLWVMVEDTPALASAHWWRHVDPVILRHSAGLGGSRTFERVEIAGVLSYAPCNSPSAMRQHRRHELNCKKP